MIMEVIAGLITTAVVAGGTFALRYVATTRSRRVRVSFCAIVRIRADDHYVLFASPSRPGSYGPPGGIYKYKEDTGETRLNEIGYHDEERPKPLRPDMIRDLRGFITLGKVRAFKRWFKSGHGRESGAECLHRELTEELAEVGAFELISDVDKLTFILFRSIKEGPHREPGPDHLHLRQFDVYDIAIDSNDTAPTFKRRLLELAEDPSHDRIIAVGARDIEHGRCDSGLIGGHSAFLIGTKRFHPTTPAIR
jgi:hypothetical protein